MSRIALLDLNDAIIAALKANTNIWGATGKLKVIKEYEGDAEDYLSGIAQSIPNTPCGLVLMNEAPLQMQGTEYSFAHPISFSILVISGDLRGGVNRKRELLEIYEEVFDTLAGKRLDLEMDPIEPKGWRVSFEGARHSAIEIEFEALSDFDVDYERPT